MKNLKRLSAAVVLTCVLGLSAFAGQTMTPCPPPEPGQTMTPCDSGPPAALGDTDTPTGATTAPGEMATPTLATSFTEFAADVLLNFLPLF